MTTGDIFSLAVRTIRSNKLRTGLTVAIIAFGIMALVGIITAIKAMNQKFTESFSTMGANGFTIRYKERNIRFGGGDVQLTKKGAKKQKQSNLNQPLTEEEAELFIQRFQYPSSISSISAFGGNNALISYSSHKTTPNVFMFGGDENYIDINGFSLQAGRNF